VWGFDNGRVRRYPDRDGFMTEATDVFDLDGDGGLGLEVYSNDCEPRCAEGTVTGELLGYDPEYDEYSRVA
jgi:hypothetical protein